WHTIELPDGTVTPGRVDYRGERGERFLLPKDLIGKAVLDLGTYDGFWAIEAKKRGAKYVQATDRFTEMLETAMFALGSYDIPYACSGDLDYKLEVFNGFDVVLFFGILYHLKNPYMGIENACRCCKPGGMVIVESAISQGKAALLPNDVPTIWIVDELHHGDSTNYCVPNEAAILQLAKMAGLQYTGDKAYDTEGGNSRVTMSFIKNTACPLCNAFVHFAFSKNGFTYFECADCKSIVAH